MNSGKFGEDVTVKYLEGCGYEILERNFHSRWGEIDIIAKINGCLVFCEVKTRKSISYGRPSEYVTKNKMEKIIKTAMVYVGDTEAEMRFDVSEVFIKNDGYEINYIENAFGGSYEIFAY